MTDLNSVYGENGSNIQFLMRRKNGEITLQWQSFEGSISQNGVAFLSVQQTIRTPPAEPMDFPIHLEHKGVSKLGFLRVDTFSSIMLKFYLDPSESGSDVQAGDHVLVRGSCVKWIMYDAKRRC